MSPGGGLFLGLDLIDSGLVSYYYYWIGTQDLILTEIISTFMFVKILLVTSEKEGAAQENVIPLKKFNLPHSRKYDWQIK